MKLWKIIASLFLLIQLSSCTPYDCDCTPPEIPAHWRTEANEASTDVNIRWWEQFEDPILDDLILEALQYNQDIKVALANVEDYYARWIIARSPLYPQIFENISGTRQELSIDLNPLPAGTPRIFNQYNFLTNVNWELDLFGKIQSFAAGTLAQLVAQEELHRTVILTVVSNVASSYVSLGVLDKQLEISWRTLRSREEAAHVAVLRLEMGTVSELEVRQAQSEVEAARAQIVRFEELVAVQENLLSVLVGHAPSDVDRGKTLDQWCLPFEVPAGLPSELLYQRPDIVQAEQELKATFAFVDAARAAFFPDISLTGFFGFESLELKNLFTERARAWQYGLNILQPIFTGYRLTAQLEAAEAQSREALHRYFQTILTAFQDVEDALVAHKKALELVEVLSRREFILKEYLRLATLQYNNGQVDYLNVLDAERNLFAAQLDLAQAQGDTFLSLISLYKALGGGWVVDAEALTTPTCDCE